MDSVTYFTHHCRTASGVKNNKIATLQYDDIALTNSFNLPILDLIQKKLKAVYVPIINLLILYRYY